MKRLLIWCLPLFVAIGCTGQSDALPAKAFAEKLSATANPQLLDVRTPEEFRSGHIDGAVNANWNGPEFESTAKSLDKTKPVFVYCLSGGRSARAAKKLSDMGFTKVYDLQGGFLKWQANAPSDEAQSTVPVGICPQEYGEAIKSGKVLVNFYAKWCEPCQKMKPYMEKLAATEGPLKVIRLDADEHKTMVRELKVTELPALFLYQDGKLTWTHTGYIAEDELKKHL